MKFTTARTCESCQQSSVSQIWSGVGGGGLGGGLCDLELDVGSLLGGGDGNSWDCLPKGQATRGSEGQDHTDTASLGAFHQLFSKK